MVGKSSDYKETTGEASVKTSQLTPFPDVGTSCKQRIYQLHLEIKICRLAIHALHPNLPLSSVK